MKHYIDKDDLVAEIKRVKEFYENIQKLKPVYESNIEDCNDLLSFIDTLEVKKVDLEKEVQSWVEDNSVNGYYREDVYETAEHFFELGLAVNNPTTTIDKSKEYSFNIQSVLFNQLTKEQQALWRKEIEQAFIDGSK